MIAPAYHSKKESGTILDLKVLFSKDTESVILLTEKDKQFLLLLKQMINIRCMATEIPIDLLIYLYK